MDTVPPLLTLQQLRDTGPLGQHLILAARHHVGEAGLEQAASLERLLVVCRRQSAVSTALRALGWALGHSGDDSAAGERGALLTALREQLEDAERAERVLADALRDITSTPVIFISAAALTAIEQRAQQQLADAERLVARAGASGVTPQERDALRQVDEGMRTSLEQVAAEDLQGQAQSMVYLIKAAVTRLTALPTLPDPALADFLQDVVADLRYHADPTNRGPGS